MYHSDSGLLQEPRRLTTFYFLHGKVQSFLFIYTPLDSLSEKGALSIDFSQCCFFHCNQGRRVFSLGNRAITEVWRRRQKKTNGTTWIFYRNRMKTFWYEKWSAFQVLSKTSKVVTSFILFISRCETLLFASCKSNFDMKIGLSVSKRKCFTILNYRM